MANEPEASPTPTPAPTPPPDRPPGELAWIRESLNKLDGKFDKLEDRLRRVEYRVYWAAGMVTAAVIIFGLLQVILRVFDVSITLK